VPKFSPSDGQTLVEADIVVTGTVSGFIQAENLSTAGGCVEHWCLAGLIHVNAPAPHMLPLTVNPQVCGTDYLAPFDGTIDFGGASGVTHSDQFGESQTSLSITNPGALAQYFTGAGSLTFEATALDNSNCGGCGNVEAILGPSDAVAISITYTYCSAGADMCVPGRGGVIACPCRNAQVPPGSTKGCNNSAGSGGAVLGSGGQALLSSDTVVFSTAGELATATSIVLQGNALASNGTVFGQGVRCAGGVLKRLYTKIASGGSIVAPQVGDATVSARSRTLGDTIVAGETRWYTVYYRDPNISIVCLSSASFNATQGQAIAWQP
jgi:hypothetical protein